MEHSVPDSRCLWDHGRLSQCFVPKGGGGLIGLHKLHINLWDVHGCRDFIVQQVVVSHLTSLGVKKHLLRQSISNPHSHTTVNLSSSKRRIENLAAVVNRYHAVDFNLADRNIHL